MIATLIVLAAIAAYALYFRGKLREYLFVKRMRAYNERVKRAQEGVRVLNASLINGVYHA